MLDFMPHEVLLQFDMFSGELVDTRTTAQKQRDAAATKPRQMEMFSQRELAQYVPPPLMSLSPETKLVLIQEDTRTEEEKERDRETAAQKLTIPLFDEQPEPVEAATLICAGVSFVDDDDEAGEPDAITRETATFDKRPEALAEIERVVADIAQTVAAAPDVLRAQSVWLALATVEANATGVPREEVIAILHRLDDTLPKEYPRGKPSNNVYPPGKLQITPESMAGVHLPPSLV